MLIKLSFILLHFVISPATAACQLASFPTWYAFILALHFFPRSSCFTSSTFFMNAAFPSNGIRCPLGIHARSTGLPKNWTWYSLELTPVARVNTLVKMSRSGSGATRHGQYG